MSFDFHMHTTFSDGTLSPDKLISLAAKRRIKILSVTDHDTISNYAEVNQACNKYDLQLIKGIEISSHLEDKDTHILAYFEHEEDYQKLAEIEYENKQRRITRLYKICENLALQGIEIDADQILSVSANKAITRPQIAQEMVKKGYVKSVQDAFTEYLYDGSKSYIPASQIHTYELLEKVREFGGLTVLAHPDTRFINREDLIIEMVKHGLQGIEIHHPSHDLLKRNHYTNLCRKYNLVVTGGSDYHGIKGKEDNLGKTKLLEADYQRFIARIKECADNQLTLNKSNL